MKNQILILILLLPTICFGQYPRPNCYDCNEQLCNDIVIQANEKESQAQSYLYGRDSRAWRKNKRIRKSRREYKKAIKLYEKAQSGKCFENNEMKYKLISCYNQIERYGKSRKILKPIRRDSVYSLEFFNYFFSTKNKASNIRELRKRGFISWSCGGTSDVIDSEHYYSSILLHNASILYKERDYKLLLHYLHHSNIRSNWSADIRLNRINKILNKMFLLSLNQIYSIEEIQMEYSNSNMSSDDLFLESIGENMNYAKLEFTLFGFDLKIYEDKPTRIAQRNSMKDTNSIMNFDSNDDLKNQTILKSEIENAIHNKG